MTKILRAFQLQRFERAAVKAVTYRVWGTCVTVIIAFMVTERVDLAATIGGAELLIKTCTYYVHEKFWETL